MKKAWIFIAIGALVGLVVTLLIKIKKWSSEIEYGVADGVSLLGMSAQSVRVLVPMWIYNPTPFNMVASDMNLKIYFNGYYVSTLINPKNYMLKSKENSTYPIEVNARPADILNLLAEQGTVIDEPNWLSKVQVRVVGTVTLEIGVLKIRDFEIDMTDSLKYYVG